MRTLDDCQAVSMNEKDYLQPLLPDTYGHLLNSSNGSPPLKERGQVVLKRISVHRKVERSSRGPGVQLNGRLFIQRISVHRKVERSSRGPGVQLNGRLFIQRISVHRKDERSWRGPGVQLNGRLFIQRTSVHRKVGVPRRTWCSLNGEEFIKRTNVHRKVECSSQKILCSSNGHVLVTRTTSVHIKDIIKRKSKG